MTASFSLSGLRDPCISGRRPLSRLPVAETTRAVTGPTKTPSPICSRLDAPESSKKRVALDRYIWEIQSKHRSSALQVIQTLPRHSRYRYLLVDPQVPPR